MSAPAVADMRALLGLGPDISDAAVVDAYVASLGFGITVEAASPAPADPFAIAAAALFRAPGSAAATYLTPDGSESVTGRSICSTTPVDIIIGSRTIRAGATLIQLQVSDFVGQDFAPVAGGTVVIGAATWKILGKPRLDVEGVSWTCEAAEG